MRFSVALPTAGEGLSSPIPFVNPEQMIQIARLSEKLGYHSVWGNDHLSTQEYVKRTFPDPPNYYEVLITLAIVAAHTSKLGIATGILVVPMREPVLLAKQLSTLDQFSQGRLIVGVGVGAYREEFTSVFPDKKSANRGDMFEEGLQAVTRLLSEREASFHGEYYWFEGVESFPKPKQKELPLYIAGNSKKAIERAAKWGYGWMPADLPRDVLRTSVLQLREEAEKIGRDITTIDVAPQYGVALAKTHEEAVDYFQKSQAYQHLLSLKSSTLKDVDEETFIMSNLIGTPEEVVERIAEYKEAGMTHCAALCFDTLTMEEMYEQMQWFAEDVMPAFG